MVSAPVFDKPLHPELVQNPLAYRINWDFCHVPRVCKMLRRFVTETAAGCRASESTFWVISTDGKRIEGAVNSGRDYEKVEKLAVAANDSVVGLIATTGITACIGPGESMPEESMNQEITKKFSVRNMVAAPVMIESQICGVVSAINVIEGEKFKHEDLDMLQWRAYLLGLVLMDILRNDD